MYMYNTPDYVKWLQITIDRDRIEQDRSFAYLGSLVTDDSRCECEIKRRIAIAKDQFYED